MNQPKRIAVTWHPSLEEAHTLSSEIVAALKSRSVDDVQAFSLNDKSFRSALRDGRFDLTTEDYLAMARRKTACYSCAAPLAIGSIIGGASPEQVNALRAYGMACGLAFQIQDDLLNLVGIREAARKDFRNDITEGKRTLMAVYALEHSSDSKELVGLLSSGTTREDDLARAVEIMQGCGAMGFARDYAQSLVEEAKPGLTAVFTQASEPRELLLAMADFFIERLL